MKPRHAQTDENQAAIVRGLRERGAVVAVLDVSEEGVPDLLVCWQGLHVLEVKSEKGRVRKGQRTWAEEAAARGVRVHLVRTLRQATDAIGMTGARAQANQEALRELAEHLHRRARGAPPASAHPRLRSSKRTFVNAWEEGHEAPVEPIRRMHELYTNGQEDGT